MPVADKIDKKAFEDLELSSPVKETAPPAKKAETPELELKIEAPPLSPEKPLKPLEKTDEGRVGEGASAAPQVSASTSDYKQLPYYYDVEKILEEGLEEVYLSMSPQLQKEFRKKGEETSAQVAELLSSTKLKVNQVVKGIFHLILSWLKMIPGVNKFFLEQEVKIKSDKILAIKNKKHD